MGLRDHAWQLMSETRALAFLEMINPAIRPSPLDPETTEVRFAPLPFYLDCHLVALIDHGRAAPNRRFALVSSREAVLLNRSNEPIYRTNEHAALRLDPGTAPAYAAFFFDHVAGRHGRFRIVESADELPWLPDADPAARAAAAREVAPLAFERVDGETIVLGASIAFKTSIFTSRIRIEPDGMIALADEDLRLEGLPIAAELPPGQDPFHAASEGQLY